MAPEDTMPKPADNEFPDLVEAATGETDAPEAEDEDDEEMRGGGLPPARFPH